MQLAELVETSRALGSTRKRKEKVHRLADLLRRLSPQEQTIGARFLAGETRQGRIGIGYATIAKTEGASPAESPGLSLMDVDEALERIVHTKGSGSSEQRLEILRGLLGMATPDEQDFLRRLLIGELRHGALEGLLVEAVAVAADVPASEVRRARMLTGDVGAVVIAALADGKGGLDAFSLRLFTPIHPMLAGTAQGIEDAMNKLGDAILEVKLDGARIQVHKSGPEVRVYSRRLNDVTAAVPEVVETVKSLPADTLILDGETLALDPDGSPLPFQTTMRRFGRRLEVERLRAELPLSSLFFDVLFRDGSDLLNETTEARHDLLCEILPEAHRVPRWRTQDVETADGYFAETLARGHEGLMAKAPEAPYEAGHRGSHWLKVKPTHTLDLVVIAAEWGSGRRQGWLSNLHLAARDPENETFVMLGKTFKGLTDALLQWQTQALLDREVGREGHIVHVRPELVVEIAFDGLQDSPHYPGGLALRFARVRRYRSDKTPAEADAIQTVRQLRGQRPRS